MFNELSETSGTGSRAAQKEATRQAVLAAAREEFERVGFDAANVRSIAARAKVSPGTVLHHCADKKDLLHAALFDDLDATLKAAVGRLGAGPLEHQLQRLTRAVFAYYQARPALSRTLVKESLFADDAWAKRFSAQVAELHAAIAGLAQGAVARGELRRDTNGPLLAIAYFSFFYFALISWTQGSFPSPVELVDHLLSQHLEGLRPPIKRTRKKGNR